MPEALRPVPAAALAAILAGGAPLPARDLLVRAAAHGVLEAAAPAWIASGALGPAEARIAAARRRALGARNLAWAAEAARVHALLEAGGVPAAVLKGPVLAARAYLDPGARPYGDLDLLVRPADAERARRILEADGRVLARGEPGAAGGYHAELVDPAGARAPLELHWGLALPHARAGLAPAALLDRRVRVDLGPGAVAALAPDDDLVALALHGARHAWAGLAWILDLERALTAGAAEVGDLPGAARRAGLEDPTGLGLRLAADLLGAPLPPAAARLAHRRRAGRPIEGIRARLARWPVEVPGPAEELALFWSLRPGPASRLRLLRRALALLARPGADGRAPTPGRIARTLARAVPRAVGRGGSAGAAGSVRGER